MTKKLTDTRAPTAPQSYGKIADLYQREQKLGARVVEIVRAVERFTTENGAGGSEAVQNAYATIQETARSLGLLGEEAQP